MHKGDEAPVIVWDYDSRRDLYQLVGITEAVNILSFSNDDRFLAAAGANGVFYIWDMQTGEVMYPYYLFCIGSERERSTSTLSSNSTCVLTLFLSSSLSLSLPS